MPPSNRLNKITLYKWAIPGLVFMLWAPAALQAQGNFKLLARAGNDPRQACTAAAKKAGTAGTHRFHNRNRRLNPAQKERVRYLRRELGNLIPRLEKRHRELTRIYPRLNRRAVFVRKNSVPALRDGLLVQNKQFLNAHYDNQGRLHCLVLDARRYTLRRADLWTRRIVRLDFQNKEPRMEFETLGRNTRVLSRDARIGPRARIRILRLAIRHVRDLIYAAEFITAEHVRRRGIIRANEKRAREDRVILRRARRRP